MNKFNFRYDPDKDRWEKVGHMPSSRSWLSSVGLKVVQLLFNFIEQYEFALFGQVKSDCMPDPS